MDLPATLLVLFPTIGVALFAVWWGYRYQLYSLDRESRKAAYLEAEDCLECLADLALDLERISYGYWLLRQQGQEIKRNPESVAAILEEGGPGLELRVRLLEVLSRLGAEADWRLLSVSQDGGSTDELLRQHLSRLDSAVLRERESVRRRFNLSIRTASASSRYGVIWLAILRRSRVQWTTQSVLLRVHSTFQDLVTWFSGDVKTPRPVDWNSVDDALRRVRTTIAKDLGTLGNMDAPFPSRREGAPWPKELLQAASAPRGRVGPAPGKG